MEDKLQVLYQIFGAPHCMRQALLEGNLLGPLGRTRTRTPRVPESYRRSATHRKVVEIHALSLPPSN